MQKKLILALVMSTGMSLRAGEAPAVTPEAVQPANAPVDEKKPEVVEQHTEVTTQPMPVAEPAKVEAAPIEQSVEKQPTIEEAMPAAPATEQPAPEEHPEDLEIKGIDTVDVAEPKGNWLYKRIWWEKAERTYEKIKQLADKILESRIVYYARRTDLDRNTLDPFYMGQGFSQGELSEVVTFLTEQLGQEHKEGALNEKEKDLLSALAEEKKNLDHLQKNIQSITNIDHALDDALLKLSEQLNQARFYEQQAWESFKAINRELSDKKARELYYGMDTYWRNLNNINSYISGPFSQYFDQLVDRVKGEVEKIKTTMGGLKEKGIDIQQQAQKLKMGRTTESEEEMPQPEASSGFLGTIWGYLKAPFVAIGNLLGDGFSWITGLFGGGSEEISLARPEKP